MELAIIHISGVSCEVISRKRIPAGAVGLKILVDYDDVWSSLQKTAVLRGNVTRDVLNIGDEIIIPAEVIASPGQNLSIGIYGVGTDGNLVIPTLWADLGRIMSAADPSGDESTDPALPVWAQMDERIADLEQNSATFTPSLDADGTLSWSNDKNLPNPEPVNIMGPAGPKGDTGETGPQGLQGEKGEPGIAPLIVNKSSGKITTVSDSAEAPLQSLKIFGKTTQDGTPTPDAPVALESVGDGGSVTVKVGVSETDDTPQTLTVQKPTDVPVFLPGIPVATNGNYTDANGQQWVCDEVDFEKGAYVQRIRRYVFDGDENWKNLDRDDRAFYITLGSIGMGRNTRVLCNKLPYGEVTDSNTTVGIRTVNSTARSGFCIYLRLPEKHTEVTTVSAFKEWLAENPLTVYIALTEPIEHTLTDEELAQYAALYTNYPNTTIFNDVAADMELKYVADTKLYVDNKFAELASALLNNV